MNDGVVVNLPARISAKIRFQDCWIWLGAMSSTPTDYGQVQWRGKHAPAHRVVYEILVGPIPDGLTLDHLCRNHSCVNPKHLEPVTMRENTLRGVGPTAVNARKTHCHNGHEFTLLNTQVVRRRGCIERHCRKCKRETKRRLRESRRLN